MTRLTAQTDTSAATSSGPSSSRAAGSSASSTQTSTAGTGTIPAEAERPSDRAGGRADHSTVMAARDGAPDTTRVKTTEAGWLRSERRRVGNEWDRTRRE